MAAAVTTVDRWRMALPVSTVRNAIPRTVVQYWEGPTEPEIASLMSEWEKVKGFKYQRFDREAAQLFLKENFASEVLSAFHRAGKRSRAFRRVPLGLPECRGRALCRRG